MRERVRTAEEERDRAREEARECKGLREELDRERDVRLEAERAKDWAQGMVKVKEGEVDEMKKTVNTIQRAMQ